MSPAHISVADYAKRKGLVYETARRRAHEGRLGPVTLVPGRKRGMQLEISALVARGLIKPHEFDDTTQLDIWSEYAADVVTVIRRAAAEALPPEKLEHFNLLWAEIFGGGSR